MIYPAPLSPYPVGILRTPKVSGSHQADDQEVAALTKSCKASTAIDVQIFLFPTVIPDAVCWSLRHVGLVE